MKETLRLLLGYAVGGGLFLIAVPLGLAALARFGHRTWGDGFPGPAGIRWAVAVPLFILGVVFAAWSNWALLSIGQGGPTEAFGVALSPRTKKLVIVGPYRYSRNPMVFGALCLYASLALALNSILCLAAVAAAIPLFVVFLKLSEEKRLLKDFGQDFVDYRRRVPMILPWTKGRSRS